VVLGPAEDGGYYLIGMNQPRPELFAGINWGGTEVLEATLAQASGSKLRVELLRELADVDRPEELDLWRTEKERAELVSVIVPALNEEGEIGPVLERLTGEPGVEVIVVDGGSEDGTVEMAQDLGVRVEPCESGRARQMNHGARLARGGHLLFVHADTLLPEGYSHHVREILREPGVLAGALRFGIQGNRFSFRMVEKVTNWRARFLQMPYGDQGFFMRRDVFELTGGFRDLPVMEDFEMVRRLRGYGRVAIAPVSSQTSARRWKKVGVMKTTFLHQLLILAYYTGVPLERIAYWYQQRNS
jgi:hypothetical protein